MDLTELLRYEFFGNPILEWAASIGLFLLAWAVLGMVRRVVRRRLRGYVGDGSPPAIRIASEVVARTSGWFLLLIAVYLGSRVLEPTRWTETISRVTAIGLVVQMGLWATAALTMFLTLRRSRQLAADPSTVAAMDLVGFMLRVVVWSAVLLVALDNLGVNVTTLIAGLGVGGVAVALAAQNILGDLFASLSIVLDKPFVVGDFIIVDDLLGSVEHVGLKTTRVRSLSGEQLVFSNNDLLQSRIRNYGRMFERRVVSSFRVKFETPLEKLKRIPPVVREIVESQDRVRFDRAHFQAIGESAFVFEYVYYVLSPDYNRYMDVQQNINLTLLERLAADGVELAYPTRTVVVSGAAA